MGRYLTALMALAGALALGCSGAGDGGDDLEPPIMAPSKIKKGKRTKKPTETARNKRIRKDEYVLKLRSGAPVPKFLEGKVKVDGGAMDSAFSKIKMENAAKVHGFEPKNKQLAAYLGFDRTLRFKSRAPQQEVINRLQKHKDIEWVEPVTVVRNTSMPNDPYYSYQWHMQMLDVTTAWETTQGEGVIVAVIDSGVSEGDDGFFKLLTGKDFVDNDTKPTDLNGHGTHVAGTIAQASDNKKGVVGVAPKATILPVRVLDANGSGSNTWVASGIIWATDNGANIINMSLGGPTSSEVVADACQYAYEQGVTVIAATGNDGFTDFIGYPAAYSTTIAVGSVDPKKGVAFYSNQGKELDLVAPGGDTSVDHNGDGMGDGVVQQTLQDGQWNMAFMQGTSMATPHVAGVAALIYANGITEPDEIREALNSTADDLGKKGWDSAYGHGLVNPVAALEFKGNGKVAGKLEILNPKIRALSASRAVVTWQTTKPGTSMLKGSDGFKEKTMHKVTRHKVTVSGTKGKKVTYTFGTLAGDKRASAKLTHTF